MAKAHYNVNPRYTPGSPAQVDEETAFRVVDEERRGYDYTLAGAHGTIAQMEADRVGVAGIVEYREERPGTWVVLDLMTGEWFLRPFAGKATETAKAKAARLQRLKAKHQLPVREAQP